MRFYVLLTMIVVAVASSAFMAFALHPGGFSRGG